jgi:hypothetical protein
MPNWSIAKDVLLALLGLYGAVLSTVNYIQSVRKERRALVVTVSTAMPTYGSTLGDCFAKIEAINPGHRAVTASTLCLELAGGQRLFSMGSALPGISDTQLPVSLSDGQSAHLFMSYKDIGNALMSRGHTQKTKLTPICVDSLGNVYKGEPWNVDPHEFLRM